MAKMLKGPEKEAGSNFFSDVDQHLFARGTHYEIYKKLGAHFSEEKGEKGVSFAVWAPHARGVHVIGDFNNWNENTHPMTRLGPGGIYQIFIPGVKKGDCYQFLITAENGQKLRKADPFANQAQLRPGTASVVTDIENFFWTDSKWIKEQERKNYSQEPLAIYECHIGSWKRHENTENPFYNYREFADEIVEYLKKMKYTHVELLGIAEHPLDESWGYEVTGYYAPTSRYGTPEDFQYLVNTLHKNKIGVILDWVPAHFPKDEHGLAMFDGQPLFEHPDPLMSEHPHWGTKLFYYGMHEVSNFMIANALYWIREFHVDGLRVDAVASMLYLDYGKESGQWIPNRCGSNQNLDAVEFFKHLNSVVHGQFPGTLMIAEESSTWPKVTGSVQEGGLGFSFKWNMGWMHDFCEYMKKAPEERGACHHDLTFAMTYHDTENYVLPISHDEVVHLKGSMFGKMPGCRVDKYANQRLSYAYLFGHSGKKLLFMGQEFAQEREWGEGRALDWELLDNEYHRGMQEYVKELLKIYRKYPCMYQADSGWEGFEWMNADDTGRSTYSFIRKSPDAQKKLLFVLNMSPTAIPDYEVGVPEKGKYRLLLNSLDRRFAGSGAQVPDLLIAQSKPCDYQPCRLQFELPAFAALVFEF